MKKLFSILVALITTISLWAYDFKSDDLYYNITGINTVEVTYEKDSLNYSGLTTATIHASVIYSGTTYHVTSIGENAFHDCATLISVTIPESVTSIGDYAFLACSSLPSITIPNSVTSIGDWAFADCQTLTSVTLGSGVKSIGEGAFWDCTSLTSITIPESVTSIGDFAFSYCSSLTSMVVEPGNTTYDSRESCNAIVETATNTLIAGCQKTVIPNSVTSIGDRAFSYCSA